jgi:hypothetical protein
MREDISDLIFNISPTETPFISAIGTTTAGATYHRWQTDTLSAPSNTPIDEGADAALVQATPTVVVGNYTQISTKTFNVTGTLEVVEKYGRDSEIAYLAAKNARVLKTDVDFACTGVNQASLDTSPRQSGSLEAWIATNDSFGATGASGGFSAGIVAARTDGTLRPFTQLLLDDVIELCWESGAKPSIILTGAKQKTNLSQMDGVGTKGASGVTRSDRATRTIYATADLYVSNFGELRVVPSRHIRKASSIDRNIFVIDPEYAKIAYLRPWQQFDLAKTGDSIKREMLVEWTLEVCNEAAHGLVADLNDA